MTGTPDDPNACAMDTSGYVGSLHGPLDAYKHGPGLPAGPRHEIGSHPEWQGDPDLPRYASCDDECRICGRPIVALMSWQVHEVDGGGWLAPMAEPYDDDEGDLGYWLVGGGCAKKIPAAFKERV